EDGVGAQGVVVILVLVGGQDAVDAAADHLQEGVRGEVGVAWIRQGGSEGLGKGELLIELAQGQQAGVAGEGGAGRLNDDGRAEEIEGLLPDGVYPHKWPRCGSERLVGLTS